MLRYAIIMLACAGLSRSQGQSAVRLHQFLLPSIRLIYEFENVNERQVTLQSIEAEVIKLTKIRDPLAEEAAVILLQFEFDEKVKSQLKAHVVSRGRSILPLLRKYRDSPYRLPGSEFRISTHLFPRTRVILFDSLMEQIEGVMVTGLKPQVNALLIPILRNLDGMFSRPTESVKFEEEFNRLIDNLLENHSEAADETFVTLLDYFHDAGYTQLLYNETSERGPRMLKFLMAHQYKPTISVAAHFAPNLRSLCDKRTEDYEMLIEMIRLGQIYGR